MSYSSVEIEPSPDEFPWWKKTRTLTIIGVSSAVLIFVIVWIVAVTVRTAAPVLLMTTHSHSNIISFNANDGTPITANLLKLEKGKMKLSKISLRSMIILNDSHLVVLNGKKKHPFAAIFECQAHTGWKLKTVFAKNSLGIVHPYGLEYHSKKRWWLLTTQDTNSLFILDANNYKNIVKLPGMNSYFPGAVFSFIPSAHGPNGSKLIIDSYLVNKTPYSKLSKHERKLEKEYVNHGHWGLRGLALDETLGLIFVASQITHNILVIDINQRFKNIYNITIDTSLALRKRKRLASPSELRINNKYFAQTIFISDRYHGIYAYHYSRKGAKIYWYAHGSREKVRHPTGLAISADALYVVSQVRSTISVYNPNNGNFEFKLVHYYSDDISLNYEDKLDDDIVIDAQAGEGLLYLPASHKCAFNN